MAKYIGRSEQLYPLDIMLWEHRMLYASNLYTIAALDRFYNGHMLLFCRIRGVLLHQFHVLTAAAEHGSRSHYLYHVARGLCVLSSSTLRADLPTLIYVYTL